MTPAEPRILAFPGRTVRLKLLTAEEIETQADLARVAIDAVFCFADGLCEPFSAELWLACCDTVLDDPLSEPEPFRQFWLLRQEALPPGVTIRPSWENEEITTTARLTVETVAEWAEAALRACDCNEDAHGCWRELAFPAVRVLLPAGLDVPAAGLPLGDGTGEIIHPVERRGSDIYASGPNFPSTLNAPLEIAVSNEAGLLTFVLMLHWSILAEPDSPGYAHVERALARLREQGWAPA